jgi:delta-aminolevulinic acid dehydratase/porphobilinogen synthase
MPWIGYEYWDPEEAVDNRFLPAATQQKMVAEAVGLFAKMFSRLPASACAPGYRAKPHTVHAWAQHGIRVAQNGPGALLPPHFDCDEGLHLHRNVEFEPAVNANFSLDACLDTAENCFHRGLPAVISVHSINFHSTTKDFRTNTLRLLDDFLTTLERKYAALLYISDAELSDLVRHGSCHTAQGDLRINVVKKRFRKAQAIRE